METRERSAGYVLYAVGERGERRYLLLRHCNGGHWGFPKGRIEPGEGEEQAALREAKEETGIGKIEPVPGFRMVSTYSFFRGNRSVSKEVVYLLGRVNMRNANLSEEHAEWQWLAYPEAQGTLTYADTRKVLHAADQYLKLKRTADLSQSSVDRPRNA